MSDDHGPVWYDEEHEVWVYRASSLTLCTRALVASRHGLQRAPLSASSKAVIEEGNFHEPDILERMLPERGWEGLGEQQREVELEVEPGVVVRGHIDEIVEHKETRQQCVVDAKSMSRAVFLRYLHSEESKVGYLWQLSAYMEALGLPGLIAAKNRDNGELFLRFYDAPPVSLHTIQNRVLWAHHRPDVAGTTCDSDSWFCDWSYLHDKQGDRDEPVSVEDLALDALVGYYHRRKQETEVLQAELAETREEILTRLEGAERVHTPNFDITCRPQERSWLSNAKVKKMLTTEQLEKSTEKGTTVYLIVKEREIA